MQQQHWSDRIEDYVPDTRDKTKILSKFEVELFTNLIDGLMTWRDPDTQLQEIKYGDGIIKRVTHNPHNTITQGLSKPLRKKWALFVQQKFRSIEGFNKWCEQDASIEVHDPRKSMFPTFRFNPDFNLVVTMLPNYSFDVYVKQRPDCCQVTLLCNMNDVGAKKVIYNYLTNALRLDSLNGIYSEQKVYNGLQNDIRHGNFVQKVIPTNMTNDPFVWTLAYVPLDYNRVASTPAWDQFTSMFYNRDMVDNFMKWIYGIFVDDDEDRRVMWVHGPHLVGKSTMARTIANYLTTFGKHLVGSLPHAKYNNQYSFDGLEKARLAVYATDEPDDEFFKRSEVFNLTGNDIVHVQKKYRDAETLKLYVRILALSNYPPMVNKSRGQETSRLLYIKIDEKKVKKHENTRFTNLAYKKALAEEMPAFLAKCKEVYEK